MRTIRRFFVRFANLFSRRRADREFSSEIAAHIALMQEEFERRGMSPPNARREALLKIGGVEQAREMHREARSLVFFEFFLQDARFAFRMLPKNPGFTAVAVLTLALGMGVNTAVFTTFDALVLRPWPVKDPDHLAVVFRTTAEDDQGRFSYPDYLYYRDHSRSFADLSLFAFGMAVTSGDLPATEPQPVPKIAAAIGVRLPQLLQGSAKPFICFFVSGNYFPMLGTKPLAGRILGPQDDQPNGPPVVLMSGNFWQRQFHSDPKIIGSVLHLNGVPFTVVGATPMNYAATAPDVPDVWAPVAAKVQVGGFSQSDLENRLVVAGAISGRLRPGVSLSDAQAELRVLTGQLRTAYPEAEEQAGVRVVSGRNNVASLDSGAWVLIGASMAAVALLLLVACANVAGLLLSRALARRKEIAVRLALGASRGRLLRQLLTESALLGLISGAIGLPFAAWLLRLLLFQITSALPSFWGTIALQLAPDIRIFAYTLFLSCAAAVAFGLTPALQASKADVNAAIKDEGSALGRHLSRSLARHVLVAGQMAVCLVLLITSALLVRGSQQALKIDLGFESRRVIYLEMYDPGNLHYSQARKLNLNRSLVRSIESIPGVTSVAQASRGPLGGARFVSVAPLGNTSAGAGQNRGQSIDAGYSFITPSYFRTLSIPLSRGRNFSPLEAEEQAPVAIISEATARRLWPNENPLGKLLDVGEKNGDMSFSGESPPFIPKSEVIGVARDVRSLDLRKIDDAYVYLPLSPNRRWTSVLLASTEGRANPMLPLIGDEIRRADPNLPILATPLDTMISMNASFVISRVGGVLASIVGALGLLLACIGVYGMVSYAVIQRTREIGIRMALGAGKGQLLQLVLGDGMRPVLMGMLSGVVAAAGVARVLASVLFGLSFLDPASFIGVSLLLGSVALLASWIPARRTMRVDPMVALRHE